MKSYHMVWLMKWLRLLFFFIPQLSLCLFTMVIFSQTNHINVELGRRRQGPLNAEQGAEHGDSWIYLTWMLCALEMASISWSLTLTSDDPFLDTSFPISLSFSYFFFSVTFLFKHTLQSELIEQIFISPVEKNSVKQYKEDCNIYLVVQSLSCVWLFVTPWTAACQDSLSFTMS